ncbi:MAG TPA: SPASM domain-containing protein, partial [Thermoanaerobaculia bacterium]|nr:SPASM domain-containing protein [Thermoanaerobaculia bacterium]
RIRGVKGSYTHALEALRNLREAGIPHSVNTQITAEVMPHLRPLLHTIAAEGVRNWQVQLTVAMGNAADHPELILQPYRYLEFMPEFAELFDEAQELGVLIQPGNNIGYFGPYEHRWRQSEEARHWQGCGAGHTVLGIEADGTIKGCPSLATNGYAGGNVRELTIAEIWNHTDELRFTRDRSTDELWGFCGSCYYKEVCRGGCTWTSHSLLGRAGNNPYCHYRVLELAKRGQRERIVKVADAPGTSFDYGRFDLILEPLDGSGDGVVQVPPPPVAKRAHTKSDRVPPILPLCPMCEQYVFAQETTCPHCGADIVEVANVIAELEKALALAEATPVVKENAQ